MNPTLVLFLGLLVALAGCAKTDKQDSRHQSSAAGPGREVAPQPTESEPRVTAGDTLKDAAGRFRIDSDHTQIIFRVEHLGISHQYGQFTGVEGSFFIDPDAIGNSVVNLSVAMASINSGVKKRDDHLRSPDFFNVEKFPAATFKSTAVEDMGSDRYAVTGNLSLLGVTRSITVEVENGGSIVEPAAMGGRLRTGFNGIVTINRTAFGMRSMRDALGEEVTLLFAVEGTRQ